MLVGMSNQTIKMRHEQCLSTLLAARLVYSTV